MGIGEIGLAVVVEIGHRDAAAEPFFAEERAGLFGHFAKVGFAVSHEQASLLLEWVIEDLLRPARDVPIGDRDIEMAVEIRVEGDDAER